MVYAPGWQLRINGAKETGYRANYLFQGFDVQSPGQYHIEFIYQPYLTVALLLAPYGFISLIVAAYFFKKFKLQG